MSIVLKVLKRVLASLVTLFAIGVIVFLCIRMASSNNPKDLEVLTPNDALCSAYEKDGEELYMFYQPKQLDYTASDERAGYFFTTDIAIIPAANQIQTLIRYNNSTLESTVEDLGLDKELDRTAENYDFSLLLAIDITPEDTSDNLENDEDSVKYVRCHGSVVASMEKNRYNYRRVVFDLSTAELDLEQLMDEKLLLAVYLDFCYAEAIDYDNVYANMCIYDYISTNRPIELDKKDVAAIESYLNNK